MMTLSEAQALRFYTSSVRYGAMKSQLGIVQYILALKIFRSLAPFLAACFGQWPVYACSTMRSLLTVIKLKSDNQASAITKLFRIFCILSAVKEVIG